MKLLDQLPAAMAELKAERLSDIVGTLGGTP
jgi:hypothetical protein